MSSPLEQTFEHSMNFCSYVLMSKNKNYYLASIRDLPSAKARFN